MASCAFAGISYCSCLGLPVGDLTVPAPCIAAPFPTFLRASLPQPRPPHHRLPPYTLLPCRRQCLSRVWKCMCAFLNTPAHCHLLTYSPNTAAVNQFANVLSEISQGDQPPVTYPAQPAARAVSANTVVAQSGTSSSITITYKLATRHLRVRRSN